MARRAHKGSAPDADSRSGSSFTRRTFLAAAGATGAVGAAATLGACGSPVSAQSQADIVIIGAGFAGLAAAREATRRGASVVVLEADDRVGGRALTKDGADRGAQFVGPDQREINKLIRELGFQLFPSYNAGTSLFDFRGSLSPYDASVGLPALPGGAAVELLEVIGEINRLAEEVGSVAPWEAPNAAELDRQSVRTWADGLTQTEEVRFLIDAAVVAILSAEPHQVSLLYLLRSVASAGGVLPITGVNGGALESQVVGGTQQIATRMAEEFSDEELLLSHRAERITSNDDGVVVYANGAEFRAGHVIVTLPPAIAARIHYEPGLPAARDQMTQQMPQGSIIKIKATYDRPFWRDDGYSGQYLSDRFSSFGFDVSPNNGSAGALLAFVEGDQARFANQSTESERRERVLAQFADFYGVQAMSPTGYSEADWANEPWIRGGHIAFAAPGTLYPYGAALKEPVGRIHWAGAATADSWIGHMEGAVTSGYRAVDEILG